MKIGQEEIGFMSVVENITKARVKDCLMMDDEVVIVVAEGDMGLAIGRKGEHIEKVRQKTGKKVSVVEFSDTPEKFLKNLFAPASIESVTVADGVARVKVADNRRVIGKDGKRMHRAKELMQRHYNIKEIIIN